MSKKDKKKQEEEIKEQVEQQEENTEETEEKVELSPLEIAEQKVSELNDKYLRTLAEFDNFRKRSQRDIQDARNFTKINTIEEFLQVYDIFKMAIDASNSQNVNLETIKSGLDMILNEFSKTLSNLNVTQLDTQKQKFDPKLHDAIAQEFSEEIEEDYIIREQKCGYKLEQQLIRPASVIISKGKESSNEE